MTDIAVGQREPRPRALPAPEHTYLDTRSLWSWLSTTDHKRIAILYAISVTFFFLVGSGAMAVIRLELMTPQGNFVSDEAYNRLFTLHGVVMVWFFLIPSIPNIFGNFLLPLMIGAKDVAFPKLNLSAGILTLLAEHGSFTRSLREVWTPAGHFMCLIPPNTQQAMSRLRLRVFSSPGSLRSRPGSTL